MFMILGWINAPDNINKNFPGSNAPININIKAGGGGRRGGQETEGRVERGVMGGSDTRCEAREYVRDERGAAGRGWRRSVGRGEA